MASMLVHELKIKHGTEERTMLVKTDESKARNWRKSVIMFGHRTSSLKVVVILDKRNEQRARVEIPCDVQNPTKIGDFLIMIYGIDSNEKIIEECSTDSNENCPVENMNIIKIWKREVPTGKYKLKIQSKCEESILLLTEASTGERHLLQCASGTQTYEIPFPLKAATDYVVKAFSGSSIGPQKYRLCAYAHLEFRTAMLQRHVQLLYNKATEFCGSAPRCAILYLYRNKPHHYFENIRSKGGVMTKYMKNDGGDQASPLNRSIQGLFFSAYYKYFDGCPYLPSDSPFGDQRLHVGLAFFVNPYNNLYFADFFCHYSLHHVTLVVTQADSYSDHFCKQHLIPLNRFGNPFLYYNPRRNMFFTNVAINIEVLYTENINIGELILRERAFFTFCNVKGNPKGKSFIGQTKNENCQICNLKPEEIIEPGLQ